MPDKKLNDSEITIKALKKILELMLCEGDLQRTSTISHTIDLINHLQAEIKHLDDESDALRADIDFRDKEISELQAENEKLKDFASSKCEDCAGCTSWKCDCANIEAQAKAEAYKEFAERLQDRIADHLDQSLDNPDGNNYFITDVYTDIDNLLKEMGDEP